MIDVRDLRIGNWVKQCFCNQIFRVEEIYRNGYIEGEKGEGQCKFDRIEPIPLTPEILEKCGFKYIEGQRVYRLSIDESDGVEINYSIKKGKIDFEEDSTIWFISCDPYEGHEFEWVPRSLHELQNAYYFITHEELEVKL